MGEYLDGRKYFKKARIYGAVPEELFAEYNDLNIRKELGLPERGNYKFDDLLAIEQRLGQLMDESPALGE